MAVECRDPTITTATATGTAMDMDMDTGMGMGMGIIQIPKANKKRSVATSFQSFVKSHRSP